MKRIVLLLSLLLIPLLLIPIPVFAQMESFRITGNPYPEIDSAFNIQIIVQGTSRSSTGYFDVQATIYEKDNPNWRVAAFPKSVYSGGNTATIDMKQGEKPFKVNVPYILKIEHALMMTTFEFTPVEKSPSAPIIANPYKEIEDMVTENKKLKEELEKKNAVIMEQVKVIQNLAYMLKKTVFESVMNYFSI
jgi:hypothetical protein